MSKNKFFRAIRTVIFVVTTLSYFYNLSQCVSWSDGTCDAGWAVTSGVILATMLANFGMRDATERYRKDIQNVTTREEQKSVIKVHLLQTVPVWLLVIAIVAIPVLLVS